MVLPYTICFIRQSQFDDDMILMLFRNKAPNQHHWNGVGGKLKAGELPLDCVVREVHEETGIRLNTVRLAGIVTWEGADETGISGMYAYTADLAPLALTDESNRHVGAWISDEGVMRWMPVEWACDPSRKVVSTIPHYLPAMLAGCEPCDYHCAYDGADLISVTTRPLAQAVIMMASRSGSPAF